MARIEPDALQEPEAIYLAASLSAARKVEALLNGHGVVYAVQVEPLGRTTLFGSMRHGAAFYVSASQASYCRTLLASANMATGLLNDHHDRDR